MRRFSDCIRCDTITNTNRNPIEITKYSSFYSKIFSHTLSLSLSLSLSLYIYIYIYIYIYTERERGGEVELWDKKNHGQVIKIQNGNVRLIYLCPLKKKFYLLAIFVSWRLTGYMPKGRLFFFFFNEWLKMVKVIPTIIAMDTWFINNKVWNFIRLLF